mmetsp:Transcript_17245/g.20767  ORF Transcript_17245/g.20767 Transcript_17245/m.20767 type:complete len:106 (+) Transcript_17245:172-489(+)
MLSPTATTNLALSFRARSPIKLATYFFASLAPQSPILRKVTFAAAASEFTPLKQQQQQQQRHTQKKKSNRKNLDNMDNYMLIYNFYLHVFLYAYVYIICLPVSFL